MKNTRNDHMNHFLNKISNMKYHSYSLDKVNKNQKKTTSKSLTDSKTIFRDYYKSKKTKETENNNLRNSYNDINNYYIKNQNTIQEFFLNDSNQFGLKIEGNKSLEKFTLDEINQYLNKTCSHRESILRKKLLNYYYPKDNKNKLMGNKMTLTPIPYKKSVFIKNKVEKEDYLKAKRAAVFMRRLEYTHGLKHNRSKKNINKKNNFISILKGAVKTIEDWWIKILNKRKKIEKEKEKLLETLTLTEKGSFCSIEANIIQNLESEKDNSIDLNYNDDLIDNWISNQIKSLIGNKNNDFKESTHKTNIIFLSQNKNVKSKNDKSEREKKKNNITVFKSNKNKNRIKNINKRYNYFEGNKKTSSNIESLKSEQNPVKIIQNNNMLNPEGNSKEETTPSDYFQKYLRKDFTKKSKNTNNSRQNLQTLELIKSKYKTMNLNNDNEGFYSSNTLDNLLTQEEYVNPNINSIENTKYNKIMNSKSIENNRVDKDKIRIIEQRKSENYTSMSNKSKNITSDIEPIKQDEKININIPKSFNNNKKKKRNYEIRFNITKSQSLNKNIMFDKSSMDGSVDEIITKKLKEFHTNDTKYSQRINKAFNQVKAFKKYSVDSKINFNSMKFKSENLFDFLEDEY